MLLSEALEVSVKGDATHYNKTLKGLSSTAGKTVKTIGADFAKLAKITATAGLAAGGVVAGFGVYALKSAADFEKAFAEFATLYDKPTKDLEAYKNKIKEISSDLGTDLATTTKAFYQAASAGFTELADATGVVEAAGVAAVAGITDIDVATEAITRVLNAFNMEGKDAMKVADALFTVVKKGQTEFSLLAPQIGMVAGLAGEAGISMEELMAVISKVTLTAPTAETITAIRAFINAMKKPADEAKKFADEIGFEMGATVFETKGLMGVLKDLGELSKEEQDKVVGNVRAQLAYVGALKGGYESLEEHYQAQLNAAGAAQEAFAKQESTFSHMMKKIKNEVKLAAVEVGETLLPSVKKVTEYLVKEGIPKAKEWVKAFIADMQNTTSELEKWGITWGDLFNEYFWQGVWEGAKWGISKLWDLYWDFLGALGKILLDVGKGVVTKIWEGIKTGWDAFKEWFLKKWEELKQEIENLLQSINIFNPEWKGIAPSGYTPPDYFGKENKQTGGWVDGPPGPDMVPIHASRGEAYIAPNIAAAFYPLVNALAMAGERGSSYHDAATYNISFGDRWSKRLFWNEVVPSIQGAKRRGLWNRRRRY